MASKLWTLEIFRLLMLVLAGVALVSVVGFVVLGAIVAADVWLLTAPDRLHRWWLRNRLPRLARRLKLEDVARDSLGDLSATMRGCVVELSVREAMLQKNSTTLSARYLLIVRASSAMPEMSRRWLALRSACPKNSETEGIAWVRQLLRPSQKPHDADLPELTTRNDGLSCWIDPRESRAPFQPALGPRSPLTSDPGSDPERGSQSDPDPEPGSEPDPEPGSDPNPNPSADPGSDPESASPAALAPKYSSSSRGSVDERLARCLETMVDFVELLEDEDFMNRLEVGATQSREGWMRRWGLRTLLRLDPRSESTRVVCEALAEDPDPHVRIEALAAMGEKGVPALRTLTLDLREQDEIRAEALRRWLSSPKSPSVEMLIQLVPTAAPVLAETVANALGATEDPTVESPLLLLLGSKSTKVVCAAADGIGRVGGARSAQVLASMAEDERLDKVVRQAVRTALMRVRSRLTNQSAGRLSVSGFQDAAVGQLSEPAVTAPHGSVSHVEAPSSTSTDS